MSLGPPVAAGARMSRLALLGMAVVLLGLVAGCPTSHGTVRSCAEAASAPDGTPCEGFTFCPPGTACGPALTCSAGTLVREVPRCDGGSLDGGPTDTGPADAGPPDAGPCAPHVPAFGTPCHTTSECDPARFEMCFAPGASTGCGICVMAHRTCLTDADCASTDFCESYVEPCARPFSCGNGSDVTSTRCAPRCSATSCGTDATCESDGRCHPVPCFGGAYSCPALTTCVTSPTSDAHGCSRDSCTTDADCGCGGACLTGFCYDTLGSCMPPAA